MLVDGAGARRVAEDRGHRLKRSHMCQVSTDTMDHGEAAREGDAGFEGPHNTRHRGHHRCTPSMRGPHIQGVIIDLNLLWTRTSTVKMVKELAAESVAFEVCALSKAHPD